MGTRLSLVGSPQRIGRYVVGRKGVFFGWVGLVHFLGRTSFCFSFGVCVRAAGWFLWMWVVVGFGGLRVACGGM